MAQNLQQLKKRIKTSDSIAQIAKAMEMIAASKIRKTQDSVEKHNSYARKIKYITQRILTDKDLYDEIEKFSKERDGKRLVYIISPDKGLCGGLVVNLFKKVSLYVQSSDYVVAIGKKAANNVARYNYDVLASFSMGTNFPKYDYIYPIIYCDHFYQTCIEYIQEWCVLFVAPLLYIDWISLKKVPDWKYFQEY